MLLPETFSMTDTPQNIKVDLHMHSTASDGTWRPERLVEEVERAGITLFALTDHDTTQNVPAVLALARQKGLNLIPGVEINSSHNGINYHILGLGIDIGNPRLQELIKHNQEKMDAADLESIRYLEGAHPSVSVDALEAYPNNPERGGWKSLNYLIDLGLCTNHRDFFQLLKGFDPIKTVIFEEPETVIRTILDAGGTPILAHPGVSFYDKDYKGVLQMMLDAGIKGIECYHPENSEAITAYSLDFCKEHNLLITGGSDCHGTFVESRALGKPDIRLSQLRLS